MKGLFITFEGPDASGKSTQIKLLEDHLRSMGIAPVMVREPGSTSISEQIRSVILDKKNDEMLPVTEALLYAASRAQLTGEVIKPALDAGRYVISDRYLDSSIAYQSYGRGMGDVVKTINMPATGGLRPDITILLKTDTSRMRERRAQEDEDRMDAQKAEFHAEVMRGYLEIAREEPDRVVVIDGMGSIEDIAREIAGVVDRKIEKNLTGGR